MTTDLSNIKIMSATNFANVLTTLDDTLYFVESSLSKITEYHSGTSGYIIFTGGLCIQWGQLSATTSGATQNLTKKYADTNYASYATTYSASRNTYVMSCTNTSAQQIKIYAYTNSPCKWMTIGQLASGEY